MFEFVDKVDHVFTHGRAVDPINTFSSFQTGILCLRDTHNPHDALVEAVRRTRLTGKHEFCSSYLHFLNNLLAKRADFGWNGDCHVLMATVLAANAVEWAGAVLHAAAV